MDNFEYDLFEQASFNTFTGEYFIKLYEIKLPIRVYNSIKDLKFNSVDHFYNHLTSFVENHTSRYLFPGEICYFYPAIHEQKALKEITCQISGAKIVENELYYTYRPLIDNITSGKVYTIQGTLKVSLGYYDILPQNLSQFEELCSNFKLGLNSEVIDYYDFKVNAGDNALDLKKLTKKKVYHNSLT